MDSSSLDLSESPLFLSRELLSDGDDHDVLSSCSPGCSLYLPPSSDGLDEGKEPLLLSPLRDPAAEHNAAIANRLAQSGTRGKLAAATLMSAQHLDFADMMLNITHSPPKKVRRSNYKRKLPRKKKAPVFQVDPGRRRRIQSQILRRMNRLMVEYSVCVGEQLSLVLFRSNGKDGGSVHVWGATMLQKVLRNLECQIVTEMMNLLNRASSSAPPVNPEFQPSNKIPNDVQLPPLCVDGIPTSLSKMTQAQLRGFIPQMLRASTQRSTPHWGVPEFKPIWWPETVPWANVRRDNRPPESREKLPYTDVLREIIRSCYAFHGRCDLLSSLYEGCMKTPLKKARLEENVAHSSDSALPLPIEGSLPVTNACESSSASATSDQVYVAVETLQPFTVTEHSFNLTELIASPGKSLPHIQTVASPLSLVQINQSTQGEYVMVTSVPASCPDGVDHAMGNFSMIQGKNSLPACLTLPVLRLPDLGSGGGAVLSGGSLLTSLAFKPSESAPEGVDIQRPSEFAVIPTNIITSPPINFEPPVLSVTEIVDPSDDIQVGPGGTISEDQPMVSFTAPQQFDFTQICESIKLATGCAVDPTQMAHCVKVLTIPVNQVKLKPA